MELRPGYKQTEVGVIPEDWEVYELGHLVRGIFRGASPRPIDDDRWFDEKSSIGWVRISDVTKSGRRLEETTQRLSIAGMSNSRYVPSGSLIMSICATVGRPIETNIDVCIHDGFVVFDRPTGDQHFLFHLLKALEPKWSSSGQTGSQMNLNTGLIKSTKVGLPRSSSEQRAIATALSDADSLIEALEGLIAKKRQIKQGAMQDLLSGKRRLPGFSGEWEVKNIGQLAPLQRGFDLPTRTLVEGPYPVVYSNGVMTFHSFATAKGPGVVTGRSGTLGKVHYIETDYWPHNTSLWVTRFSGNEPKFIYYLFTFIDFARFASGSGVPTLNRNDAHAFAIRTPVDRLEQTAIASVLSDMDAEIDALTAKLAKARELKQGMMQELLTGRIRLVTPIQRNSVTTASAVTA